MGDGVRRAAVLGAGGMGTALAILLARAVPSVALWGRDPGRVDEMARSRRNARHLPGVDLPPNVEPEADARRAAEGAGLLVAAVPSAFLRRTMERLAPDLPAGVPVLSVVKGIEQSTFARPSQVLVEALGPRPVAVLSGPSHAEELARGLPASVVVAGEDAALNRRVRDLLNRGVLRVYTNEDVVGVELAGALKNVLGIAAGICDGLGFGDNAKAALLTRGLVEITRFGVDLGAKPTTFAGLAGLGDLITTCYSPFGRNLRVGRALGAGASLDEVLGSTNDVVEGVYTARSARDLAARRGVEMPITDEVYRVLFEAKPPRVAVGDLMVRMPKDEAL